MKPFRWNTEKNERLKKERGLCFEEIALQIENGKLLAVLENPNFSSQQLLIVEIDDYAAVVPCVESEDEFFLKTAYYSRKYTKRYLSEATDE